MWTRFRNKMSKEDKKENKEESNDVNEEYLCAIRTNSYSDFFTKAQPLVQYNCRISELLLNPNQETITTIIESPTLCKKSSYNLKSLFLNYFNVSADASTFCTHLLRNLNQLQSHYGFIHKLLNYSIDDLRCLNDPFSDTKKQDFIRSHDKHSSVLQQLRSQRKKVARKKKTLGLLNYEFLRKIEGQIDVAAKGTYILIRDFDTMSRLVDRVEDEIEHSKMMIRLCLESREDRVSYQVVKELKKSKLGLLKQVKEVEEHVYLCLLTINRGRALVINQISSLI